MFLFNLASPKLFAGDTHGFVPVYIPVILCQHSFFRICFSTKTFIHFLHRQEFFYSISRLLAFGYFSGRYFSSIGRSRDVLKNISGMILARIMNKPSMRRRVQGHCINPGMSAEHRGKPPSFSNGSMRISTRSAVHRSIAALNSCQYIDAFRYY